MVYGTRYFKTAASLDSLMIYAFRDQLTRSIWLGADPKRVWLTGDETTRNRYHRKACSRSVARVLMTLGHKPVLIVSGVTKGSIQPFWGGGRHVHFYPPSASPITARSPVAPGILVRFPSKKRANEFISCVQWRGEAQFRFLKAGHPFSRFFRINQLTLDGEIVNPAVINRILTAIPRHEIIDPTRNYLCLVCRLDWSGPRVFSFTRKSTRDLFMAFLSTHRKNFIVKPLSNFNQVALAAIVKNSVYKGPLPEAIKLALSHIKRPVVTI